MPLKLLILTVVIVDSVLAGDGKHNALKYIFVDYMISLIMVGSHNFKDE
jgi:hypothetical protein